MSEFCGMSLQKALPRGDIIEQVSHLDLCPWRTAGLGALDEFSPRYLHTGSHRRFRLTGLQPDLSDRCNTGKRLPSEAEGMDIKQVLPGGNLAGGMTPEGYDGILTAHPYPVIRHRDQPCSPLLYLNDDPGPFCI